MQPVSFQLKNEKIRQYHRFAQFIEIINLGLFFYLTVSTTDEVTGFIAAITAIVLAIVLIVDWLQSRYRENAGAGWRVAGLLVSAAGWIATSTWWAVALCIILALLYQVVRRPLTVSISAEAVAYNSFPAKRLEWQELNNVILKDGLLTVDLKSDKIIQSEIAENTVVNEEEFNEFCRSRLAAGPRTG